VIAMRGAVPKVSVLIPCYNLGQYVDEAVESVLAQTLQDFEILVVDDGSTDPATAALLDTYQRRNTRVIRIPHAGLAAARNAAIAQSSGEYLCALDADDRLDPSYFAKAVPVLDMDASVTFVSAWLTVFGDEEWEWKPERCDLPTLLWENTVLTAALVRRDAVVAVGGYDAAMPGQGDEDWDLWLTLVKEGHRGVILREVLFNYRRRPGSMSAHCWYGPGHMPLTKYRVSKHEATYREHLEEVLLHQDESTAEFLRQNDQLERYIASELEPAVTLRREELTALKARLAGSNRVAELELAVRTTAAEVNALRTSMSWRVTAPLRQLYGWWLQLRGGA
jgi:glycosyltransferase involved in cell wall biosynthesis